MEILLAISIVASIVINAITLSILKKSQSHPVEILPVLESTIECNCGPAFVEEIKLVIQPLLEAATPKAPSPPDEVYKAWKNRVEEPTVAPPSPHGPPPIPGPLQRPYGFSR